MVIGSPRFWRNGDRHGFGVELARIPGRGRALVRADGIGIGILAGNIVILGKIFGGFDHSGNHPETF